MRRKGIFITFEGSDGVGKSTHINLLAEWLKRRGRKVVLTREPGGGRISEKIRHILLNPATQITDRTELFLYEAARADHVERVIEPALQKGAVVLCDRFTDATVAYQGIARGIDIKLIEMLNKAATQGLTPDLTIWLDLPPHYGLKRARNRLTSRQGDRLENQGLQFQRKVREGYRRQYDRHRKRIIRISVQPSISHTQELIRSAVRRKVKFGI